MTQDKTRLDLRSGNAQGFLSISQPETRWEVASPEWQNWDGTKKRMFQTFEMVFFLFFMGKIQFPGNGIWDHRPLIWMLFFWMQRNSVDFLSLFLFFNFNFRATLVSASSIPVFLSSRQQHPHQNQVRGFSKITLHNLEEFQTPPFLLWCLYALTLLLWSNKTKKLSNHFVIRDSLREVDSKIK